MIRATGAWLYAAISLGMAGLLCPQSAEAQSDAETLAALRACGALVGDRYRLACFDGVLAAEHAEPLAARPAEPLEAESAAPLAAESAAPAPPAAGAAAPLAVASAAPLAVAVEGRTATESTSAAPSATRSASPEPVAARPVNDAPVTAQNAEADRPRIVTIVEVNAALAGAARFLTDTGQLIVQTSGGTPRGGFPNVPFDATLEDGAFGSLFLAVDERRRVRVVLPD